MGSMAEDHHLLSPHTIMTQQSTLDCMKYYQWGMLFFPCPGLFEIAWLTGYRVVEQPLVEHNKMSGWNNRDRATPGIIMTHQSTLN